MVTNLHFLPLGHPGLGILLWPSFSLVEEEHALRSPSALGDSDTAEDRQEEHSSINLVQVYCLDDGSLPVCLQLLPSQRILAVSEPPETQVSSFTLTTSLKEKLFGQHPEKH